MNWFDRVVANIVMGVFTAALVVVVVRMLITYLKGVG